MMCTIYICILGPFFFFFQLWCHLFVSFFSIRIYLFVLFSLGLHASLVVMVCLFAHLLVVLDDAELYEAGQPLPLHHINTLVRGLKRPLFVFYWDVRRHDYTKSFFFYKIRTSILLVFFFREKVQAFFVVCGVVY